MSIMHAAMLACVCVLLLLLLFYYCSFYYFYYCCCCFCYYYYFFCYYDCFCCCFCYRTASSGNCVKIHYFRYFIMTRVSLAATCSLLVHPHLLCHSFYNFVFNSILFACHISLRTHNPP